MASLPESVLPPGLYSAAIASQTEHASQEARVAALHVLLRSCEHRVLQVLYPLMEVCAAALAVSCPLCNA